MSIFYTLLLAVSVSLDAVVAGTAYGMNGVRIRLPSLLVVGAVTALCTTVAMVSAATLGGFIDTRLCVVLGALLLLLLGLWNLLQEYVAKLVAPDAGRPQRQLALPVGRLLIFIMLNPEKADLDGSGDISPNEGLLLGLSLGVDNMVATFAACLVGFLPLYTPVIMAAVQMLLLAGGASAARVLRRPWLQQRLPFLPGAILVILGLLRLR